jgi:thiamine pyrophosphokinase
MSSHHYVKEGQEPALIIANGEMCSYELLVSIMEWCPYIVALDGAYDRLVSMQISPDIVIGDLDSLQALKEAVHTQFIKDENQENTDLEKAIDYLLSKGRTDINIVWSTGKRLDHTLNNLATLVKYPEAKIVVYDNHSKAFVLPKSYIKFYDKGTSLSLIPLHTAKGISTENLKYNLNKEALEFGKRSGTSNEAATSGKVSISYSEGTLVLIENTD